MKDFDKMSSWNDFWNIEWNKNRLYIVYNYNNGYWALTLHKAKFVEWKTTKISIFSLSQFIT
jgi:hypothetical protein